MLRRQIRDRYSRRRGGGEGGGSALFHVFGHTPGVDTLSHILNVNGQQVEPFFRYRAGDASVSGWPAWGYGSLLGYESGAAPDFDLASPGLGVDDKALKFNAGAYFLGGGGQVDLEDFVVEGIFWHATSSPYSIMGTLGLQGWGMSVAPGNLLTLGIDAGSLQLLSAAISQNSYYHFLAAVNRDDASVYGAVICINGRIEANRSLSAYQGSLNSSYFAIGASTEGTFNMLGNVAYMAGWKRSSWLAADNAAEIEAVAAERFYRWSGTWPTSAAGTWAPTLATRAFGAYIENEDTSSPYTKRFYQVGSEHLRVQRAMIGGVPFLGYRAEPQSTNLIISSEGLPIFWFAVRCTISQDAANTPDGDNRTVVDALVASVDNNDHYIEITPGWNNGQYQWASCFAKPGAVDWLLVEFTNSGDYAYVDVANGVVGDTTLADGPWLEKVGDYYRVTLFADLDALDKFRLYPSDGGTVGDEVFTGDGSTPSVYVWGVQAEDETLPCPSSLINTAGATGTRLADALAYKGDDGNITAGQGRTIFFVVVPSPDDFQPPLGTKCVFLALSDGRAAADAISVYWENDEIAKFKVAVAASGGAAGFVAINGELGDGDIHEIEVVWRSNYLNMRVDGVWGTADTTVDIPDDLDVIDICRDLDGSNPGGYLLSDCWIFPS